jgi:hypothetical protein
VSHPHIYRALPRGGGSGSEQWLWARATPAKANAKALADNTSLHKSISLVRGHAQAQPPPLWWLMYICFSLVKQLKVDTKRTQNGVKLYLLMSLRAYILYL